MFFFYLFFSSFICYALLFYNVQCTRKFYFPNFFQNTHLKTEKSLQGFLKTESSPDINTNEFFIKKNLDSSGSINDESVPVSLEIPKNQEPLHDTEMKESSINTGVLSQYNKSEEFMQPILSSKPNDSLPFIEYPTCDIAFESTVCFFNQEHVLLPPARSYGMIGHYTFDMIHPLDFSGHRNHAVGQTLSSFPMGTTGTSALFRKNYIFVPHTKSFDSLNYSITFWIYRLEDESSLENAKKTKPLLQWCPLIHKGLLQNSKVSRDTAKLEANPSIMLNPSTGRLKVVESTDEVEASQGEFFISNFRIKTHRWYHIAYVHHEKTSHLYIDGLMDSTMTTKGSQRKNEMPLYIGGAPWSESLCDVPIAIDHLKIFVISLGKEFIHAEASSALAGVEASNFFFSCNDCTKLQAEEGCPENFHLCTHIELMMGGFHVIDKLGLRKRDSAIFTGDTTFEAEQLERSMLMKDENPKSLGVGFCCRDAQD